MYAPRGYWWVTDHVPGTNTVRLKLKNFIGFTVAQSRVVVAHCNCGIEFYDQRHSLCECLETQARKILRSRGVFVEKPRKKFIRTELERFHDA